MTTTPTERRLAITPGPVTVELRTGRYKLVGGDGDVFATFDRAEDAEACADANNTYQACHLTPSELLAKLREAEAEWKFWHAQATAPRNDAQF